MSYAVKEVFYTLQGEGAHSGTPAVFLRFAGCNLWSGQAETREADAARTGATCPRFCDTDFVGGERLTADQVVQRVIAAGAGPQVPIVATGGEPLLQLDLPLLRALDKHLIQVFVETNGTARPKPGVADRVAWICMSPKVAPERLVLDRCDEIKVVFPAYDPLTYAAVNASHRFVQPEDGPNAAEHQQQAVAFVLGHPGWRLSLQTHKLLGVP